MIGGDELRAAMRRHADAVAIVTLAADGQRLGVTVGSLVSLSLEPPLMGISIGHASSFHEPLRQARRFAVNLLGADQAALAQQFARSGVPPIALWSGVALRETPFEAPLLADALAWLECDTCARYGAGDHTIFVGAVLSVELGRDAPSLVYVGGEYRGI